MGKKMIRFVLVSAVVMVAAALLFLGLAKGTVAKTPLPQGESCGLPPIPPLPELGCKSMRPQCVCVDVKDANGYTHKQCHWEFVCVSE